MTDLLHPDALVVIAVMAVVTYGLRAGGLLLADRLPRTGRWAYALRRLPGMVLVAVVAPGLAHLGWLGVGAGAVTVALAIVTRNLFAAMAGGVTVVALARLWL